VLKQTNNKQKGDTTMTMSREQFHAMIEAIIDSKKEEEKQEKQDEKK
jgi:hypothetical protein